MKSLIIYYNAEKTAYQRITPSDKFNGNWDALAHAIAGTKTFHSYIIQ